MPTEKSLERKSSKKNHAFGSASLFQLEEYSDGLFLSSEGCDGSSTGTLAADYAALATVDGAKYSVSFACAPQVAAGDSCTATCDGAYTGSTTHTCEYTDSEGATVIADWDWKANTAPITCSNILKLFLGFSQISKP